MRAVAEQSPPASPSHGWKPSMPGRSISSSSSDWRAEEDTAALAMNGATWSNARAPEFIPRGGAPNNSTGALPRSNSSSSWSAASGAQQHLNHTTTSNSSLSIAHEEGVPGEQQQDVPSWWPATEEGESTVPSGPAPPPPPRTIHSIGLSDALWRHYREVSLEARREMDPTDPRHKAIPPSFVNGYLLDFDVQGNSATNIVGARSSFGYPSLVFKVTSREDGHLYCLRRLDNCRAVSHKIAAAVTDRWTTSGITLDPTNPVRVPVVDHPGLVRFHRCFVAQRAVFFVHHYHPGAQTLRERFFAAQNNAVVAPLPEPMIWSIVTQLVSAMRVVHGSNLACRSLQLNHILCIPTDEVAGSPAGTYGSGRFRIRINCIGVSDALEFEARKQLPDLQQEDMRDLGRLILSLATGSEITPNNTNGDTLRRCDAFLSRNYSGNLHRLAISLMARQAPPSIYDLSVGLADRVFSELDASHSTADRLGTCLSAEYESGRALRLLLKLGMINERPEFGMDSRWSETGDCYVLQLFRDYVFHQADGAGRPVMDLGHVTTALNKLDVADEEKIVLTSRDGKSLLVVSFADVARCLEGAFGELCAGSVPPPSMNSGGGGQGVVRY